MAVHLEPFCREDLEFVRGLRNGFRQYFFDTASIDPWQQEEWYKKYLLSDCLMWTVWWFNRKVGTISLTCLPNSWVITDGSMNSRVRIDSYEIGNLMLLPEYQGKGIMLESMRQLTAMNPLAVYMAQVKPDNAASLRLFKSAGFWRVPKKKKKVKK